MASDQWLAETVKPQHVQGCQDVPTVRTDLLAEGIRDREVAPTGIFYRR